MFAGHLDRCVSGQVALNILAACDEEKKSNSTGVPSKSKSSLSRKISHITSNLPTSTATAAVKKLRKSSHQSTSSPSSSPKLSGEWEGNENSFILAFLFLFLFLFLFCFLITNTNRMISSWGEFLSVSGRFSVAVHGFSSRGERIPV